MHPKTPSCSVLCRALLAALPLCVLLAGLAKAQEPAKPPVLAGSLIVPIGGTQRLQMSKKQVIAKAINRNEAVLRVSPVYGDPTTVLLNGLEPGVAVVTLIDEANKEENFQIIVQLDVEYLKSLLRRAVPTANIDPIPAANNTVVLNGTVPRAEDVEVVLRIAQSVVLGPDRIINHLRVEGVQQVQLCVVVAAVNRSLERQFGFSFIEQGNHQFTSNVFPGGGSITSNLLTSAAAVTGNVAGNPNAIFGIINGHEGFLGVLQALRTEGLAKVLAEPRLVTLSGKPASFLSGGEQAVPVPAGLGQVGVQFEEFGTRLNFLPIVLGDGRIYLEVEPEFSTLNAANGTSISGVTVPGRTTQRVHTAVEIEPGQTLAIGGLIQNQVNATAQKFPVLGDLPYFGAAFSTKQFTETEEELIVLVTPHLVDPMSCDQLPKYLPGLETRSPDDCELFLEGILEAPRGPRTPWEGCHYQAAYKNGPSAAQYPCAGGHCGGRGCAGGACAGGACAGGACGSEGPHMAGPVSGLLSPIPAPLDSHAAAPAGGVTPAAADPAPKATDPAPKAADAEPKPGELPALLPPPAK
jgi:pilus assembly protein CpaC